MRHTVDFPGDIVRPVGIGDQLLHRLAFHLDGAFQIYAELKHIAGPSLGALRQKVLGDVQVLKIRMVLVFELAAVLHPGISRFGRAFTYGYNLSVDLDLPGLVRVYLNFFDGVFNFLVRYHEYGGLAGLQREAAVLIHGYRNGIALVVFSVLVENSRAGNVFRVGTVRRAGIQRLYLVVFRIVFKGCLEFVLLVDEPRIYSLRDLFFHNNFARAHNLQVELDVQVGRTRAALHIEGLEIVVGVVCEGVRCSVSVHILPGNGIDPVLYILRRAAVVQHIHEDLVQRLLSSKTGSGRVVDLAGGKIDGAAQRLMDAADVQHKHAVDVDPHVVVAGEFEDHGVSILQSAVFQLGKVGLHLHAREEVWDALRAVNILVGTSVTDRQFADRLAILIVVSVLIHQARDVRCHVDVVKRHIVAVRIIGMPRCGIVRIRRGRLTVDREAGIAVLSQVGKVVLRAIAEHAAFIIIALEEQIGHAGLRVGHRTAVRGEQAGHRACRRTGGKSGLQIRLHQGVRLMRLITIGDAAFRSNHIRHGIQLVAGIVFKIISSVVKDGDVNAERFAVHGFDPLCSGGRHVAGNREQELVRGACNPGAG